MPELFILNPTKRRHAKKRKRARRSSGRFVQRHPGASGANPVKKRRKHRSRSKHRKHKFNANPIRHGRKHGGHRRRRFRHNPIGNVGNVFKFFTESLAPAALGSAAALALDVGLGYLPLPATLKASPFYPLVRIGGAVALGVAASFVTSRQKAEMIAAGALTTTLYDVTRQYVKTNFPTVPGLSGLSYYPRIAYRPQPGAQPGQSGATRTTQQTPSYLGNPGASPMEGGDTWLSQQGGEWLGESPSYLGTYE